MVIKAHPVSSGMEGGGVLQHAANGLVQMWSLSKQPDISDHPEVTKGSKLSSHMGVTLSQAAGGVASIRETGTGFTYGARDQ